MRRDAVWEPWRQLISMLQDTTTWHTSAWRHNPEWSEFIFSRKDEHKRWLTGPALINFTQFITEFSVLQPGVQRGQMAPGTRSLAPHVRNWGLSQANVLYWRKYLWYCWDFFAPPAVIWRPRNDSAPGELRPPCPPRNAPACNALCTLSCTCFATPDFYQYMLQCYRYKSLQICPKELNVAEEVVKALENTFTFYYSM